MSASAHIHDNAGWPMASPVLSVLIPFLRDDPGVLLALLEREALALDGQIQLDGWLGRLMQPFVKL